MFAIKKMRKRAKLSQQDVADALGIKTGRYGDWERETTMINLRDAIRLADLFRCSLDELAGVDIGDMATLTANEGELIDAYRASDERGRGNILSTAQREKIESESVVVRMEVS